MSDPPDGLVARFSTRRAAFTLELELRVEPGSVTALVGPNGAGKSTALRTIAGLYRPTDGVIRLGGRMLDDPAAGLHVEPRDRGIGVVFQDYLLFPHLDAAENVAFGLLARGRDRGDSLRRAGVVLDALGVGELQHRRPRELSGGQAQRVALARALVLEPPLLLLDEPLAALDASSRLDVRADLGDTMRAFGGATVLVTHDPVDASALADELIVLEEGSVVQRGTPAEVSRAPRSSYVAELLGLCVLTTPDGGRIVFDPTAVSLHRVRPEDPASDLLIRGFVRGIEQLGSRVRVLLTTAEGDDRFSSDLDVRLFAARPVGRGDEVWATVRGEV